MVQHVSISDCGLRSFGENEEGRFSSHAPRLANRAGCTDLFLKIFSAPKMIDARIEGTP